MNRHARRTLGKTLRGKTPEEQYAALQMAVNLGWSAEFSEDELRLARDVGAAATGPFYHGGAPGFEPGFILLPAGQTGAFRKGGTRNVKFQGETFRYSEDRKRHVFISTSIPLAEGFAAQAGGDLYRVEPEGDLLGDLEHIRPFLACCKTPGTEWYKAFKKDGWEGTVRSYVQNVFQYCCPSAKVVQVLRRAA